MGRSQPPSRSLPVRLPLPCGDSSWGERGALGMAHLRPRSSGGALRPGGTSVAFLAGLSLLALGAWLAISTLSQEGGSRA